MSAEIINLLLRLLKEAKKWAEKSEGDMLKSTYDPDNDGKVVITDDSDTLEGSTKSQVQDHTPKSHTHPLMSPNYDSGFVSIGNFITTDFVHNLNTKDFLVQIFIRSPGSAYHTLWGSTTDVNHGAWIHDNNTIKIVNKWGITKEFRLLLWEF